MVQISVRHNIKQVSRGLTSFQRRQLPFATSQALNSTAFDTRARMIAETFPKAFDLRNKGFARGILRVAKAAKRKLIASVFDQRGLDYLVMQQAGGIKKARDGGKLAIPKEARRTARGVSKADRPRQIVRSAKGFATDRAIWRKTGRGGKKLKLMHLLVRQARIRPRLPFNRDGERFALARFNRHFQRWLIKASRTAR